MKHRVVEATCIRGHVLRLRFEDGIEGEIDLEGELDGEVFGPLEDPVVFRSFRLDPTLGTLVWSGGADFAPEFLRERLRVDA
jgi:hypothetical protein